MKKIAFLTIILLSGCASEVMKTYVGKDITEVFMDYGPPAGAIDLPDGRRAFMWTDVQTMTMPATTTYSGIQNGRWVSGNATTYGGGTSSWECVYTFMGQRNGKGSYTVVGIRQPSLECE